jgi:DNA-binding NtrC family response regulator
VGLIAAAGKGSVFLDEIGDLDLHSQARLLRVQGASSRSQSSGRHKSSHGFCDESRSR